MKTIATALLGVALLVLPAPADATVRYQIIQQTRCHPDINCSVAQVRYCHVGHGKFGKKLYCTQWQTPSYAR